MSTFFTSDTHFGHTNVIKYDNRPFITVYDMWKTMRDNWNAVVKDDDVVYHLGDVAFGSPSFTRDLISQLNGQKILIRGNHDGSMARAGRLGFTAVYDSMTLDDHIYLTHSPYGTLADRAEKLARALHLTGPATKAVTATSPLPLLQTQTGIDVVLHGHIHTSGWLYRVDNGRTFINAGCMRWSYTPRTLDELLQNGY